MSLETDHEALRLRQQTALHVYQEMLTAVAPEVRSALESLVDLVRAEQDLCRCGCIIHTTKDHN